MFDSRKEYIDILNKLEYELKGETEINNVNYWPVIRIHLGYIFHLIFNKSYQKLKNLEFKRNRPSLIRVIYLLIKYKILKIKIQRLLKREIQDKCIEVLFTGFDGHADVVNGKYNNNYIDPVKTELDKTGHNYLTLYISGRLEFTEDKLLQKYFSICKIYYTSKHNFITFFFGNAEKKVNYLSKKTFAKTYINQLISFSYIDDTVNKIIQNIILYNTFKDILSVVKPKKVWEYVYYDNHILALNRAADALNITTIEYQHSLITNDHFAYSKWTEPNLYCQFFPRKFWVWRKSEQQLIKKSFAECPSIEIIEGGNIFLAREKKKYLSRQPVSSKKGILVCLQGQGIPDFIETGIISNPEYKWFFRFHPRYPEDMPLIKAIHKKYPRQTDIHISNTLPLYELFSYVKYNLTAFSGTALEAQSFDIQNIIFSREGYESYKDYILNKQFLYIENEDKLNAILKEGVVYPQNYDKIIANSDSISYHLKRLVLS